ncbi:MAG: helix-turn-helix transcriptional regulator [Bacteroidota bacterium]
MKNTIGYRIRKHREAKDLSQENIAFELGLSRSAYNKIETGSTSPNTNRLQEIAKVLEVDITEFFKDPKAFGKAEDPKLQYGFATKSDIEEMMKVIHSMLTEINELKVSVHAASKPALKKAKSKK